MRAEPVCLGPRVTAVAHRPYVLVVSLAPRDPMCTLFFAHLGDRVPLRIEPHPGRHTAAALSGASAVVVIRGLFEFGGLPACARRLGIPLYYFQDDNFMLIRNEAGTHGSLYDHYTDDRVREKLAAFSGVLLATETLQSYFRERRLHWRLMLYPPVTGPRIGLPPKPPDHPLTVAFFGGAHRREPFVRYVYPAVCRLARQRPITLVASGLDAGSLPAADGVTVRYPGYDGSYSAALEQVARLGVDILVHPSAESANNVYKNPHVLINARMIGAVPVFSDVAPYDRVRDDGVALLCANAEDDWYDAMNRLATDAPLRAATRARLAEYCDRNFGGDRNVEIIQQILRQHPAPGAAARAFRRVFAAACLVPGRAVRRFKRAVTG